MKTLLLNLLLFVAINTFAQQQFEITGNVPLKTSTVILSSNDSSFNEITVAPKSGKYKLAGTLNQNFGCVNLVIQDSDNNTLGWWPFFIKQGKMKVDIAMNKKTGKYEPSFYNIPYVNENSEYEKMKAAGQDTNLKIIEFQRIHYERKTQIADSINKVRKIINDNWINTMTAFVKRDFNAYISLYVFDIEIVNSGKGILRVNIDSLCEMYAKFDQSLKNTKIGISIAHELEKRKPLSIGKQVPVFSFSDSLMNNYNLSDLYKNKFVLLSFWDATCIPCIQSFPIIKSIHAKYAQQLEIIHVSLDRTDDRWKAALKRHNLPWINTCNIEPYIKNLNIEQLYNITYIPQYFLINKTGKIIYHNVQSGDNDDYEILLGMLAEIGK